MTDALTDEKQVWTECKKQLPPDDDWVLGWNSTAKGSWLYAYSHHKREWFSHSGVNFHQLITHWMPLPKGPAS